MSDLSQQPLIIDGLVVGRFDRELLLEMRAGGVDAANCSCSIWEGLSGSLATMARWKRVLRENADISVLISSTQDIRRAKAERLTGIILGWQNTSGFGNNADTVQIFSELGLKVVQLTYNTANAVGFGCYESFDHGLTDFGRDIVGELNRCRIMIDLSHVGPRTCQDAIAASNAPVAYTHCCPAGLVPHPRNKTDEQLRDIAQAGGFVGVTCFPSFLPGRDAATLDSYLDAIAYVVDRVGEEQVGLGTDSTQNQPAAFFDWITRDKGTGRKLVEFDRTLALPGFERLSQFPHLLAQMERRGWTAARIERVVGGNWMRFLEDVWER